jgi:hypothetical protein
MISLKRIREWVRVISGPRVRFRDWKKIIFGLGKLWFLSVDRITWRQRMRACYNCPVFDPQRKTCRPFPESDMGCGCYTPYSNLLEDGECWGRGRFGENFGWE